MFGTVLVDHTGQVHGPWAGGCRLFLQPPGHLHLTGRGQGKKEEVEMLNHNV